MLRRLLSLWTAVAVLLVVCCLSTTNASIFDADVNIGDLTPVDSAFEDVSLFSRFQRAPMDRSSMVRFGKRAPMDRSTMVRFGKRAPMDRSTMVRFGKRAPMDRSTMVRFGKRIPMDRSSMVRFGKRLAFDEA